MTAQLMESTAIQQTTSTQIENNSTVESFTNKTLKHGELVKPDFGNELKDRYIELYQQDKSQIKLDKYPGTWLLSVYSIESLDLRSGEKVSVNVKGQDFNYKSDKMSGNEFLKPNIFINFPLKSKKKIMVKIEVNKHVGNKSFVYKTTHLEFDPDSPDNFDNELIEHKLNLKDAPRMINAVKFWRKRNNEESLCRCYSSYIADSDLKFFRCMPSNFVSMCKWIIFRKNAFDLLFSERVNIKCEETSYKWQIKNIKWFGFVLILLNDKDGLPESFINLFNCEPVVENISKKAIRFRFEDKLIDIECTSIESFEKCLNAACKNFPKLLNFFS